MARVGRLGVAWLVVGCTTEVPVPDVASPLVATERVDDLEACDGPGVRVLVGLDDGRGGGEAGDGELHPDEVRSTDVLCDPELPDDTGTAPIPSAYPDRTPPPGPMGEARIVARSGEGFISPPAGRIDLLLRGASSHGHILVFPTGAADAASGITGLPAAALGTRPWVVDGDITLPYTTTPDDLAPGSAFHRPSGDLRIWDGEQSHPVTGVHVLPGATLSIEPNASSTAPLHVTGDIRIEGTLTALDTTAGSHPRLSLRALRIHLGPGARIDQIGEDRVSVRGQAGGGVAIDAFADVARPYPGGEVILLGEIDLRGGAGSVGAPGGALTIEAGQRIHVGGTVDSRGGDGSAGAGGDGGPLQIEVSGDGAASVDATIDLSAGDGTDVQGGDAGGIEMDAVSVLFDGDVTMHGGDLTACSVAVCDAGDAGGTLLVARGGPLFAAGRVAAHGGHTHAVGTSGMSHGGAGGWVDLDVVQTVDRLVPEQARQVRVSTDLSLVGGDATVGEGIGGNPGSLLVDVDGTGHDLASIHLLGFAAFDLSGRRNRDLATRAGSGGGRLLVTIGAQADNLAFVQAGGVHLGVPVDASGADTPGGANGGLVEIQHRGTVLPEDPERRVVVDAPLDLSGGAATNAPGGRGGVFEIAAPSDVWVSGLVDVSGGDGLGDTTDGGDAARQEGEPGVWLRSTAGDVTMSGGLLGRGGRGGGTAGTGAVVDLEGRHVTIEGVYDARGGDGRIGTTGDGGGGGTLILSSLDRATDRSAATVGVAGGDGPGERGIDGIFLVDGAPVAGDDLPP